MGDRGQLGNFILLYTNRGEMSEMSVMCPVYIEVLLLDVMHEEIQSVRAGKWRYAGPQRHSKM